MNAPGVAGSLVVALLLLLPEEVLFRGYAFQRLVTLHVLLRRLE